MLKAADDHLRFVFITSVTKFSKVSIFSDLNQLRDISTSEAYVGICGICEDGLELYFSQDIRGSTSDADARTLYRVGRAFGTATRLLADWKVI